MFFPDDVYMFGLSKKQLIRGQWTMSTDNDRPSIVRKVVEDGNFLDHSSWSYAGQGCDPMDIGCCECLDPVLSGCTRASRFQLKITL
jgi:hypothetical protein